jgi:Dyp-type peroxidase family
VTVELADVQGLIVRGYTMPVVRYLGLSVHTLETARSFLGALAGGSPDLPAVTTAAPWAVKPDSCVNLGITYPGLVALEVPSQHLASFPPEYAQGAARRAAIVGDTGASAPDHWLAWLVDPRLHLLLSVFAQSPDALESTTKRLQQTWSPGCVELGRLDGQLPPGDIAHFGYRDGLSQPTIEDVPPAGLPDHMPPAPLGAFLLGYPSQQVGFTYPVPTPQQLGINGSFAAFRVLVQDVDAFADFLTEQAERTGMPQELIAAKLCGRWRNGTPLVLSPDTDTPDPPTPSEALNDFDYDNDVKGYRCPIGAHIRRMYPRGERVAGNGAHRHRIVRRGMPYGPPYDPTYPNDGQERGLLGFFIGVSLSDQFEFMMINWANDRLFTAGLGPNDKDPLVGACHDGSGGFSIPRPEGLVVLDGFSRFVTTHGGAYCFLPSITGIRYLADPAAPFSSDSN